MVPDDMRRAGLAADLPWKAGESMPRVMGALSPYATLLIHAFIESHLAGSCRREDAARAAGLSKSQFTRAFRNRFGCCFRRYLQDRRIALAQEMMLTDMPLSQIAISCGMADQAHLSKFFRRRVGQAPSAWRRSVRARGTLATL
jgi:AraC family transcriptional regulator